MFRRLLFALFLFAAPVIGSYGLQASHGGFCTASEIEAWYFAGESLDAIEDHCQVLDVRCSAADVFYMIDDGYSMSDVYDECG